MHWLREIENFFDTYKALENVRTVVRGWDHFEKALQVIEECRRRYRESNLGDR
jgi:inorganic pyrophosphatase